MTANARLMTASLALSATLLSLPAHSAAAETRDPRNRPSVVVVLAIDQFRGDYINRFDSVLGDDGFRRVAREGTVYENCCYLHANTETGPGHATMLTGSYANRNGITGNNWYDDTLGKSTYCVEDENTKPLTSDGVLEPPAEDASGVLPKATIYRPTMSSSPRNLLAETVGDVLESATHGQSKTLSISAKDRSAILMSGHSADLAVWWDARRGELISSDYYGTKLPDWLIAFNKARPADKWFKKAWDLSLPKETYEKFCTIDDYPAESTGGYATRTFPHILGEKSTEPDGEFYSNIYGSPFANDLLVDAALAGIEAESLGKDDAADLLTISFSANDAIGHAFGPDSWEVMDATIKTDQSLARLMKGLDDQIGKGRWSLFITADHGVAAFPELRREQRIDAQRVAPKEFEKKITDFLGKTFGPAKEGREYVLGVSDPWVRIDEDAAMVAPTSPMDEALAQFLAAQPEVAFATTTRKLLASPNPTDPIQSALLYGYRPGRCGQVAFALPPNYFFASSKVGTTHGSPYRYDQYVAMLACGNGIQHGRRSEPVSPPQIAPTVSVLLGLVPPNLCQVPPLPGALE